MMAAAHNDGAIDGLDRGGAAQYTEQYFKQMQVNHWVKVHAQGQVFTPRTGHECIFADGNIYLFAGTDDDERLNDLY